MSLFALPLRGHKTSYDTDGNSPPLVSPGESKTDIDEGTEGSEKNEGKPHDCLCH